MSTERARRTGDMFGTATLYVTIMVWSERDFAYHEYILSVRDGDADEFRRLHHRPPMQIVTRAKVY